MPLRGLKPRERIEALQLPRDTRSDAASKPLIALAVYEAQTVERRFEKT